jgi:hypothetical protein
MYRIVFKAEDIIDTEGSASNGGKHQWVPMFASNNNCIQYISQVFSFWQLYHLDNGYML